MNQILVTEKLYITPEIKRKKRMYKIRFFMSVFLICVLFYGMGTIISLLKAINNNLSKK